MILKVIFAIGKRINKLKPPPIILHIMDLVPDALYGRIDIDIPYCYYTERDGGGPPIITYYTDDNPPPITTYIHISDGIYRKKSTRSDIFYPTLRDLGSINVTERKFSKHSHFQNKIVQQNDDTVVLFNYHNNPEHHTYTHLNVLCRQQGYTDEFVEKMINVIIRTTYDNKIRTTSGSIDF